MERDVVCSHGSARFLGEKFFNHSDGFYIYICANCGNYAVVNHYKKIYECKQCGDEANIYEVPSSWSSKLLFHELESSCIGTKFIMEPAKYQDYSDWQGDAP